MRNAIDESKELHGKASVCLLRKYYHAMNKVENDPKEKKINFRNLEKYCYYNDGNYMKFSSSFRILMEGKDYPDLDFTSLTNDSLNSIFEEQSFEVRITFQNIICSLKIEKTREKFEPEKSKAFIKNNKVYIFLYKGNAPNWFTLKGFE